MSNTLESTAELSTEEKRALLARLLREKNGTPRAPEPWAHRLFEAQAGRTPDAVAVACDGRRLTYRALDARANQLAHRLRRLGVGPETRVALCLERSPEMLVGLLGVLKAGGAYVPLDPDYPAERLAFMLDDARAGVLLTQDRLLQALPASGTAVVRLDADWEAIAREDERAPAVRVAPENLAYVIYTSGSTGRPKGVLVSHRNLAHSTHARFLYYREPVAGFLLVSSLAFDSSVAGLFWTLAQGGTLVLPRQGEQADPARLARLVRDHRTSHLLCVPSLFALMLSEAPADALEGLHVAIVAGEPCPPELVEAHHKRLPRAALFNEYGPTEATVWSTVSRCHASAPRTPVPIGRPIANTRVYILDARLQPVPVGVTGELYIGGLGVARGYLKRPGLTAEKFLPDPFGTEPGARLYRTGDLCRWRADGNLEFLGRVDHQVKIRGYRIELGEVEAALMRHPAVRATVVAARRDTARDQRLVAYLVAKPEPPAPAELRQFLKRTLPEYMVPSAFVALEALPLTPNGKVDRDALPAPDPAQAEREAPPIAARNAVEEVLARVTAEVLGRGPVGIHDNFFELGLDSILSIQIASRVRQAGLHLSPAQVFRHQTIAELAAVTAPAAPDTAEPDEVAGPVPLTPIQRWFFEQELPEPHHYNQALLLEVSPAPDAALVAEALGHLIRHHDALGLRFARDESGWRQWVAFDDGVAVPFSRVDLAALPRAARVPALEAEAARLQAGLDLGRGPLLQVALFDLGPGQPGRLLLVVHHLAIDGVSWRVLLEDLATVYGQLARGESPALPPKTTSFRRWAEALTRAADMEELGREADYWLAEARPPLVPLPVDFAEDRGPGTVATAEAVSVALGVAETRALLQDVPRAYNTRIDDALLTALAQTLRVWAGAGAVLVDLEGHGRDEVVDGVDLSRTVGWFTTIFPVRLELPEADDLGVVLKGVKERLRNIPRRGIGYGMLRFLGRDADVSQRLRTLPRAAIRFNYLGQLDQALPASAGFAPALESAGATHAASEPRAHPLEVDAGVLGGRLQLRWAYSTEAHRRETIERLAEGFLEALRALIAHCRSPEAHGYTPSDFPLARLDQAALDRAFADERGVEDVYPLSPVQEGMLFHTMYDPELGAYVEQFACILEGGLDVEAFRAAWRRVIARHAALRTSIRWVDPARPLQVVHRDVPLPLRELDWRDLELGERDARLADFLRTDRARGFAPSEPPLMRLVLLRLADDVYQLVWSTHHLLMDGWCLPIVLGEVLASYEAAVHGRAPHLPPTRPYRDFIAWLGQHDPSRAEAFWREALRGARAATPLGIDRVGAAGVGAEEPFAERRRRLSAATTATLQAWARASQLTLNTVVQGAWAVLLSRYSGQPEVIFGVTVAGRPAELPGVESMVGLFINTLPVRVAVPERAALVPWLKQLQEHQVELRQYEQSPLVQVQGWSNVPRGQPLFESIFVFENYPTDASLGARQGGLGARSTRVLEQTNYPLTVIVAPDAELLLRVGYDARRFDADAIERLLGHLQSLLEGIAAEPERRIADLPLLTEAERRRVLVDWTATAADSPHEACFHHLFEAQAERTPDEVALTFEGRRLTYGELNARANRLAHRLRALDVGPEVRVALGVERSPEMLVGLLGILKAGGAYVPLDPDYPAERLAFMLNDARAAVLLTQGRLRGVLPAVGAKVICLDADWEAIAPESERSPAIRVAPEGLAYVIYTSGSTGKPKGVQVTHGALANFLRAMLQQLGITGRDTLLAVTTLSFDIAALELFLPLAVGARVVLVGRDEAADGARLIARLEDSGATFLQATPATWRLLLEAGWAGSPSLTLLCGGEALTRELADWLLDRGAALWNLYGPTETTIWSSSARLEPGPGPITIGRPILNTRIYVLDADLRPVPIGVTGELYIGGAGLARGYLNRPGLTAERFLPDPIGPEPGGRIYRTGDLARWRPDGTLECLGRIDHQVKIRGFRIELGEIETALAQHPAVRQAAVVAREDTPGDKRLVAYLVARRGEPAPSRAELRPWLTGTLPDYMVPSAFVALDALPLTPNGKVDRKALPAPEADRPASGREFVAPRTTAEEAVASAWAAVLGLDRVGALDDFFELGGHSLLATQVASRLRDAFAIEVPVRMLFEATTVATLAERLENSRGGEADRGRAAEAIGRVERSGPLPLSFAQQALWFLDQLSPGQATFNVATAVRIEGPLDADALRRSFQEIVRRHETLRTTFAMVDGRPVQVIAESLDLELDVLDLGGLADDRREAEAVRLAVEEARRPFDLARGPLVRTRLLRLGQRDHVLLLTMHHIVTDGWSFGVAADELVAIYATSLEGKPVTLPELPIQYADYAHWQRQRLRGEVLDRLLGYWSKQLARVTPLELPTDHPRPAVRTARGAFRSFALAPELSAKLDALGRREGATPFITLLAAFQALLHRYSGQDDIVVGAPIANRGRAETERLIGFFVNMLALRTDLSGDPSFRALLGRVREVALGAFEHQELPLELLIEAIQPRRDPSRTPLFQVMFVLQNNRMPDVGRQELTLRPLPTPEGTGTAKFDLTLALEETPRGLAGGIEYNTDLFDAATIDRMVGHFETLLEAVAEDPDRRLSELPILTAPERRRLFNEWGWAPAAGPAPRLVTELFEAHTARAPEAVALVADGRSLSYGGLNRRANQLAHHLRALGVGPEVRVGLVLTDPIERLVGVLGVLKAGGAYVPLDPASPRQRLAFQLDDAGAAVLLTEGRLLGELPDHEAFVVRLDSDGNRIAAHPEEDPGRFATPEHLAYVIYTSGSTGTPKGVMVTHASLAAMYRAWEGAYELRPGATRHLQMASFAFDVFTGDWVRALGSGGTLVACPRETLLAPAELYALMVRERVDCAEFVPAVVEGLVAYLEAGGRSLDFMRLIAVGSDAWHADAYERLRRLAGPSTRVVNSYGLTEATIDSLYFEGALADRPANRPVPIGRPFAGTRVYVLDRHLQPVPVGVPGEIHVGGAGLARGYHHRPGLTAERFPPSPFAEAPGERLYKTGDVARWLPDGNLELLGRVDHQVKIRGFRVEPAEVESALLQHPDVRESVVAVVETGAGGKSLAAYLVPRRDREIDFEGLRRFLKERLPAYMVPSAFLLLEALPLTPNGKVDRDALPPPDPASLALETEYVPPRTPTEEVVASIWAEVLGRDRVGVLDDFFDLGGHSLLATQVASRLRDALAIEVPVRMLFEATTVAALAERLEDARRGGLTRSAPPIRRVDRSGPLPLSFAQQRLWFLDQWQPSNPFYNVPIAVRIVGTLDVPALERAVGEIVRRHEVLRTRFVAADGEPRQAIAEPPDLALDVVDLGSLPEARREAEARRMLEEGARRPFDLAEGPPLRLGLIRLGEREHVAMAVLHHIAVDGWSLGVLGRQVAALYQAFTRGLPSPLPEPTLQYADFAAWQRQWLRGEALEAQLDYWKGRLAGVKVLELPTDRPRPAVPSFQGGSRTRVLPRALLSGFRALGRQEGASLFMTLLAAFHVLLRRYSGQEDIAVGSPVAGRNRSEVEGLVGFFVNTLVLRGDLSGDPSFRELLRRVKQVALEAYAHQDVPFEQLVEALQPDRGSGRSPLFQVMFVVQNAPPPPARLSGLELTLLEADNGTAKFDLTLIVAEAEEGLRATLEYSADLFDAATIDRMLGHYQTLLEAIVAAPDRRISGLTPMDEDERRRILVDWNATEAGSPPEGPVHRLFEAQAARTAGAVAVAFEDRRLTYGELNARANRLAHRLRARGVGPEVRVGLYMERSHKLIAGVLGVLKAGGAYVPLDPSYPGDRLEWMLSDSGIRVLLTEPALLDRLPPHSAEVLCLDGDGAACASEPEDDPEVGATLDDLAYVIYTSGSTGRPKGVLVSHRNLAHSTHARFLYYREPVAGFLLVSSLAFDSSVAGLFWTLAQGGTLVLPRQGEQGDPARLARLIQDHRLSHVLSVPSLFALLLSEAPADALDDLRVAIVAGEPCPPRLVEAHHERLPRAALFNEYGPTEATVWSTVHLCDDAEGSAPVPIGRPIADARVYILDARLQPVPIGVAGELYIGGAGVARGYLDRPGLTAEKFLPDPFGHAPGGRLYRSGDLCRWRADGEIEFLGRADDQVKVRGHRVELGEIEAALAQHPEVREAAVAARDDATGDRRLVGYIVPWPDAAPTAPALRRWLKERLPAYMVPSALEVLEALPLSPNGKVDRDALPPPDPVSLALETEYVPPRTPTEEVIAAIWAEVLGRDRVGVLDDFFDLGGHSLQAVQLVSRLAAALGRPVPVGTIFRATTVAEMAEVLDRKAPDPTGPSHATSEANGTAAVLAGLSTPPEAWAEAPPYVTVEERPLLPLFATGKLAPVDSVALGYLPSSLPRLTGLDPEAVIRGWCGDLPMVLGVRETPLGRIGSVLLPRFDDQLYLDRRDLLAVLGDAVRLSRHLGARTVSLTGLLPSATGYGRDLAEALAGQDLPRITTGHATTTAAVVLAIRRALEDGGRSPAGERVGFVGLGSVGMATLRLMLSCLPHPAELSLCDVYQKRDELQALGREVVDELGYRGAVHLLESRREVPEALYGASLIVGATNVPDLLDVERLAPGTILVDDSAPHAFRPDAALRRFRERGDILVTEGGVLSAPEPLAHLVHVPAGLEPWMRAEVASHLARSRPRLITGCVFSGLLSARFEHLPPTLGLIDRATALKHVEALDALGFEAAPLHLDDTLLDERIVADFRSRFGDAPRPDPLASGASDRGPVEVA